MLQVLALLTVCWIVARPRAERPRAEPAQDRKQTVKEKRSGVSELLAHPFCLLFAGAALSSLLVPRVSSEWQGRAKELEVKTTLVTQMSEAVAEYVSFQSLRVLAPQLGTTEEKQQREGEAHQKWAKGHEVVRAQLSAYFPGTPLSIQWSDYSQKLDEFSSLNGSTDEDYRMKVSDILYAYFDQNIPSFDGAGVAWDTLSDPADPSYQISWYRLRRLLVQRNIHLTERVMASCSSLRSFRFPWNRCE
jgi:hypothetical protein